MYLQRLKNLMAARNLNRAAIARLAGVSRAAVTRWFRHVRPAGWVNVESSTLMTLARGLAVPMESLLKESSDLAPLQARFLWDRLYPTMEDFVAALRRLDPPAIGRLVQELGLGESVRLIGKSAVTLFDRYKKFVHPVRRRQLEILWPLYH